jgi:hypothetical protein
MRVEVGMLVEVVCVNKFNCVSGIMEETTEGGNDKRKTSFAVHKKIRMYKNPKHEYINGICDNRAWVEVFFLYGIESLEHNSSRSSK